MNLNPPKSECTGANMSFNASVSLLREMDRQRGQESPSRDTTKDQLCTSDDEETPREELGSLWTAMHSGPISSPHSNPVVTETPILSETTVPVCRHHELPSSIEPSQNMVWVPQTLDRAEQACWHESPSSSTVEAKDPVQTMQPSDIGGDFAAWISSRHYGSCELLAGATLASTQEPELGTARGTDARNYNQHVHVTDQVLTSSKPAVSEIVVPQKYDVLYGRGKTHRKHPGNKRMQLLADIHRKAYLSAPDRDDKTYITRGIVNIIKSSGNSRGRFLRFEVDQNCWLEVSDEVARKKVGHALRDGRGRQMRRIDPKELEEIAPLLSDEFKQVAIQMGSSNADASVEQA